MDTELLVRKSCGAATLVNSAECCDRRAFVLGSNCRVLIMTIPKPASGGLFSPVTNLSEMARHDANLSGGLIIDLPIAASSTGLHAHRRCLQHLPALHHCGDRPAAERISNRD
jgi:hypothetical protein